MAAGVTDGSLRQEAVYDLAGSELTRAPRPRCQVADLTGVASNTPPLRRIPTVPHETIVYELSTRHMILLQDRKPMHEVDRAEVV